MQRTTYNEKGEEVTEMVYQDAEPEPAAPPADVKVRPLKPVDTLRTTDLVYSTYPCIPCSAHTLQVA